MFDGRSEGWRAWKLKVESYLFLLEVNFERALNEAAESTVAIDLDHVPHSLRPAGRFKFAFLISYLSGFLLEMA